MTTDYTGPALVLVIFLQLILIVMVARRAWPKPENAARQPKLTKEETKADEVAKLKAVLSSPEQMAAYALAGFKGDAKKAKESVQKRLEKLTGEWLEAPF